MNDANADDFVDDDSVVFEDDDVEEVAADFLFEGLTGEVSFMVPRVVVESNNEPYVRTLSRESLSCVGVGRLN